MIEPFDKAFATEDLQEVEYDGKNMNAPQILMDFLDHNLTKVFDFVICEFTKGQSISKCLFRIFNSSNERT